MPSSWSIKLAGTCRPASSCRQTCGRRPLAGADIGQERLQRRAVERGAGECAIVVVARDQPPRYLCSLAPPELPPRMPPYDRLSAIPKTVTNGLVLMKRITTFTAFAVVVFLAGSSIAFAEQSKDTGPVRLNAPHAQAPVPVIKPIQDNLAPEQGRGVRSCPNLRRFILLP